MQLRIAQFNLENLFDRPAVMNLDDLDEGKHILAAFASVNEHLKKPVYTAHDKNAIVDGLVNLGLGKSDDSKWAVLRQNRGRLLTRSKGKITIVAKGSADWVGWVELKEEPVAEKATEMTARVIKDVGADILGAEETEGLDALRNFNRTFLHKMQGEYEHLISVRGNDPRPIDVALMVRNGKNIESIVSHADDAIDGHRIFSRDCGEYVIQAGSATILVLVNHFKSQGYGDKKDNDRKRTAQAQRVRDIYDERRSAGFDNIVVLGDFNATPADATLQPLLGNDSDLRDISTHPKFLADHVGGTYKNGKTKLDYILLSPALYAKVTGGSTFRKGIWESPQRYDDILGPGEAASDHALLYADIDV